MSVRLPPRRADHHPAVLEGGVDDHDAAFLDRLSKIIGDRELLRGSTSTSKQGTSVFELTR